MKQGDLFSDLGADPPEPKAKKGQEGAPSSGSKKAAKRTTKKAARASAKPPATPPPLDTSPPESELESPPEPESATEPAAASESAKAVEPPREPEAPKPPVDRSGGGPGDRHERELSVTCFDRPILLAAGAGTGKTATLVARVVQWCLGPGWELEARGSKDAPEDVAAGVLRGISAITFTEAAAAEMSTRVGRALSVVQRSTASGGTVDPSELPLGLVPSELSSDAGVLFVRARALRAALEQLNISTIHAFCRRLLAAHPLEVGLDPAFEVDATFQQSAIVVREVLEEYLAEAWAEPVDEDLIELARHGVGPPEIEAAIFEMIDAGARAADFAVDPLSPETCERLVTELRDATGEALRTMRPLGDIKRGNAGKVVHALGDTFAKLAAQEGAGRAELEHLCATLPGIWDGALLRKLTEWRKGRVGATERKALGVDKDVDVEDEPLLVELVRVARAFDAALRPLAELDVERLERARRIVGLVLGRVEDELRHRGVATFSDLLAETGRLLTGNEAVAAGERRRIRQLLVDEFQDTDGLQCDIVGALALSGPAEERPGLFLVGDPKQSIFAWRSADLEAFDGFAERVREAGGMRLELTHNFRSKRGVLDEVERVVAEVMHEERGVQPAFSPLVAAKAGADESTDRTVEFWASWPRDAAGAIDVEGRERRAASYEVEARAIANDIVTRQEAGGSWSEFALVFRALTHIEPYLQELRRLGVPYEVQSDRSYYRRREVIDCSALVRAVVDPHDHLALVTLIRSPFVGVPDAALLPLWEAGFPGAVSRLRAPDLEKQERLRELVAGAASRTPASVPHIDEAAGWDASLLLALDALAEARRAFENEPLDAWIETMRALFHPEATESARFLGSYRLANQERFFRELLRAIEERGGDVQAVVRSLRSDLAREDKSEASRPSDSGQDAVRVLTIHGAKGLEFEHVYLAQTHKTSGRGRSEGNAFDRRGDVPAYRLFKAMTPSWFESARRQAEADAAERVRLLYVALTRAVRRLVVVGNFPLLQKRKAPGRADSFADLVEHRRGSGDALAELAKRALADDFTPYVDKHGVEWRIAAGGSGPRPSASSDGPAPEEAIERTAEDSRTLAMHRETAQLRSARPFHTTASAEAHHEASERRASRAFAEGDGETVASSTPVSSVRREAAQVAGTAVHRVLELATFEASELDAWRERVGDLVRGLDPAAPDDEAEKRALELLGRIENNGIWERLAALRSDVLAKELAVFLPVPEDVDDDPGAPVGFVSGAVDLLYRDPETGEVVVADYKSDAVEDEADVEARARGYALQGRRYVDAVQAALGLEAPPRFELWFLWTGTIRPIPLG